VNPVTEYFLNRVGLASHPMQVILGVLWEMCKGLTCLASADPRCHTIRETTRELISMYHKAAKQVIPVFEQLLVFVGYLTKKFANLMHALMEGQTVDSGELV
jgi:hypothetical protein